MAAELMFSTNGGFEPIGFLGADGFKEKLSYAEPLFTWGHTVESTDMYTIPLSDYSTGTALTRTARPHECPHCFRQTHPEPLTQRAALMYDSHKFDPTYDAASDNSEVVCIGADYYGPAKANLQQPFLSGGLIYGGGYAFQVWDQYYTKLQAQHHYASIDDEWAVLGEIQFFPVGEPEPCNELPITFNDPDNWKPWDNPSWPLPVLDTKPDEWRSVFPVPDSHGYDFSAFSEPEVKYPKGKKK